MNPGAKYGVLLALEAELLLHVAPQPWGALGFWSLQTAQLSTYTAVTWHRTRLVIATAGGAAAMLASILVLALTATGFSWSFLPIRWAILLSMLIAVVPLSVLAESRLHRAEWNRWKHHMQGMGLVDVLLLRHIPNLREPSA